VSAANDASLRARQARSFQRVADARQKGRFLPALRSCACGNAVLQLCAAAKINAGSQAKRWNQQPNEADQHDSQGNTKPKVLSAYQIYIAITKVHKSVSRYG
jgi:hypothetical protein